MPYTNSSGVYLSNPEGGNYEGYDGEGGVYQSGITGGAYEDQQSSQEYSSVTRAEQAALDALAAKVAAEAAQAVAELAETNAQIAEANAELAEANAEQAEGNAEAAQAAAEAARNLALAYRDAALVAKTAAEAARDLANTYATNAANSATTATTQAGIAVTQAGIAATQATNAAASASSAAATLLAIEQVFDDFDDIYLGAKASDPTVDNDGDPLVAGQIYWNTTEQEVRFYNGTAWERPEYSASQSALAALASANAASASAISASSSAANAATSASTATTQAGIATTQASNAATSATNASNSATAAATSATNAANSATSASTSATNAASSATAAAASYDSFDDRYLGVKASAPSLDNDGAALLNGALYFDSTLNIMRVYSTTGGWQSITNALASEPVRHSVRPSLLLDFANTKTLDPRITFTRGSTGTFYDGKTVAKAEENQLTYSQEFDNAAWTKTSSNITANTTTAPDGTTTADTLTDTTDATIHRIATVSTINGTSQVVLSCFAKYSTMQWIGLSVNTAGAQWAGAKFDIQNGVLGSTSSQGSGWVANSSSITSVGNGWYRCVLVLTPGNTGALVALINGATDGTTFTSLNRGSEVYTGTEKSVFIWGAQLEQRSSVTAYTATTTAPITNYIPALQTAGNNVPRFEHNPVTGESLGLEIEEQRTNLLTYSEQFDDATAAWTQVNGVTTANAIVAPNGTLTGDFFLPNATSAQHRLEQSTSITSGTAYTFSVHVKYAGYQFVGLRAANDTGNIWFDITNGTVAATTAGSGTITPVGNGWYRCTVTGTATATGPWQVRINASPTANSSSYSGNGFSGLYVWGAQLEAGSFATSYIPTVASQVTRSADSASMTGANFSSWYRADEGTLYAETAPYSAAYGGYVYALSTGTANTNTIVSYASSSVQNRIYINSSVTANLDAGTYADNQFSKSAFAFKTDDIGLSLNGGAVVTDTASAIPVVDRMMFGVSGNTSVTTGMCVKKFAYYPKRLTNAELQGLTTI